MPSSRAHLNCKPTMHGCRHAGGGRRRCCTERPPRQPCIALWSTQRPEDRCHRSKQAGFGEASARAPGSAVLWLRLPCLQRWGLAGPRLGAVGAPELLPASARCRNSAFRGLAPLAAPLAQPHNRSTLHWRTPFSVWPPPTRLARFRQPGAPHTCVHNRVVTPWSCRHRMVADHAPPGLPPPPALCRRLLAATHGAPARRLVPVQWINSHG